MDCTLEHLRQPLAAGVNRAVLKAHPAAPGKIADYPDFFEFSGA
jgi:hypothetical protein